MERDARRALIHPGTGRRVAHPARQLAQPPWLVLDQDDVEAAAARAFPQAKPPTEQRMPAICDRREYRLVCGMTCDLGFMPETLALLWHFGATFVEIQ
jgi:hypothetical protein